MTSRFGFIATLVLILITTSAAQATILFEGWFDVLLGAKKVGFAVQRYEFVDNKFKAVTYLKTNEEGGNVTESLKAFSSADLAPLSYSYTSKAGEDIKIIDATFKNGMMALKINDGKKEHKENKKIQKGTFLSVFLLYMIMQQKDGLSVGKDYAYSAIAEEDATASMGQAVVSGKEKVKGKDAFKVLNNFKKEKYFTFVTAKGEMLLTRAPEKNIDVRFAESQAEAVKGVMANMKDIKFLFGKLPGESAVEGDDSGGTNLKAGGAGKDTEAQEAENAADTEQKIALKKKKLFETHDVKPGKAAGVPGGKGLQLKGGNKETTKDAAPEKSSDTTEAPSN